ncbi:Quinic acid utilization activator [Teratosphaeria destructans]|uniref:Quinic acid utilization activator n=1 Tax=Teratosphaeria destructans TaxID=418781 RepID=A0A9W7SIV9_9PEZI|nr:Quinic acid utilization activator [Teratosphaeria destructans]
MRPANESGDDGGSRRNDGKRPNDPTASPERQGPANKRSRVSRACDQCRASREKCDGTQPRCQTCIAQRRDCTYHEQPKKRGIQPNYIRTLELIIAWQLKHLPGGERQFAAHLASVEDSVHRVISAKDSPGAEALHQRWRNSIICRQIDQMLSGATIESPATNDDMLQAYETPPSSAVRRDNASVTDTASSVARHLYGQVQSALSLAAGHALNVDQRATTVPRLKLPESTWTLLEYYFAFTHSWMPIAEKQSILKVVYTWPADGVPYDLLLHEDLGYGELCSILALSALQLERGGHAYSHAQTGELQEVAGRSGLEGDPTRLHVGSVRIALLQAVNAMVSQNWIRAWFLIGRAIRVLLRLDTNPTRSYLDRSDLKPIQLAAFVIEAAVACHLGIASTHFRPEYIEKVGLLNEDGSEEWSPWHDPLAVTASKAPAMSLSTLNRLVRLTLQSFSARGSLYSTHQDLPNYEAAASSASAALKAGPSSDPSFVVSSSGQAPSTANVKLDSLCHRAVLALLKNSLANHDRLQPMSVVARCEAESLHSGSISDMTMNFAETQQQQQQQQLGYINIPNRPAESEISGSPSMLQSNHEDAGSWIGDGATSIVSANVLSLPSETAGSGADIFEELALLDHEDSNHNPQFMQNLGFAPDLDLAEFFGSDYQPSNPLLAYMQAPFAAASSGQRQGEPD